MVSAIQGISVSASTVARMRQTRKERGSRSHTSPGRRNRRGYQKHSHQRGWRKSAVAAWPAVKPRRRATRNALSTVGIWKVVMARPTMKKTPEARSVGGTSRRASPSPAHVLWHHSPHRPNAPSSRKGRVKAARPSSPSSGSGSSSSSRLTGATASRNARASGQRPCGSRARQRMTAAARSSGVPGADWRSGGASCERRRSSTSCVEPSKGRRPLSIR
jgi:hypothetical protein